MNSTYAQKSSTVQKAADTKAASVLDSSAQSESLQRKADMANNATQRAEAPRPNNTGMPDNLKAGIESLSGFSMDDVRVHYNSSKPATVQALAYTQGTDIHVAPGQEKCLPHEAWHVAQQMAGRVFPTTNINGMPVNDNAALEHEADVMGEKAVQCKGINRTKKDTNKSISFIVAQCVKTQIECADKKEITSNDLYDVLKNTKFGCLEKKSTDWYTGFCSLKSDSAIIINDTPLKFLAKNRYIRYKDDVSSYPDLSKALVDYGKMRQKDDGNKVERTPSERQIFIAQKIRNVIKNGLTSYSQQTVDGGRQRLKNFSKTIPTRDQLQNYLGLRKTYDKNDPTSQPPNFDKATYETDIDNLSLENINNFTTDPNKTAFKFLYFEINRARSDDVSFAQAVAAAFGSETARAPETFLSSLMMLDNMESGVGYGAKKDKFYNLASLLQRPHYKEVKRDCDGKTVTEYIGKIKYSKNLVFSGESLAEDTGLAEKHKVGEYSYVGGKLAMAGNQSYNLAMQDAKKEFNPTNIVHVKQIGILINWLCNQAPSTFTSKGGQVNSNLSKEETLKKITTLVQTRASGYDYMSKGIMVADA